MARPQRTPVIVIPERPKRPEASREFKLQGGWIMHPPEQCKRKRIDVEKVFWAETIICANYCKENSSCKAYLFLMSGRKERIKYKVEGENENGK